MQRTEFCESAVKYGFYGVDKSGLFGKKDNVRKYWEDVVIKESIRPAIERILERKDKIRIVACHYPRQRHQSNSEGTETYGRNCAEAVDYPAPQSQKADNCNCIPKIVMISG
jgi:hypothetical protein